MSIATFLDIQVNVILRIASLTDLKARTFIPNIQDYFVRTETKLVVDYGRTVKIM